jgi:hypothetical protein
MLQVIFFSELLQSLLRPFQPHLRPGAAQLPIVQQQRLPQVKSYNSYLRHDGLLLRLAVNPAVFSGPKRIVHQNH